MRFFDSVVARLEQLPHVSAAGAGSSLPLSGQATGTSVVAEGRPLTPGLRPTAGWQFITPGYLAAAGIHLRDGRDFSSADRDRAAHVTIVNEDLARTLFPGESPIGRRIGVGGEDARSLRRRAFTICSGSTGAVRSTWSPAASRVTRILC